MDSAAAVTQRVFAGWSQCIEASNIFARYIDPGPPATPHIERYVFLSLNSPTRLPTAGPHAHGYQLGLFRAPGSAPTGAGTPSTTAAITPAALPVLGCIAVCGERWHRRRQVRWHRIYPRTGTAHPAGPGDHKPATWCFETRVLPAAGHALAYGQDWTVEQLDAPVLGAAAAPTMFPGNLVEFRFDLDFRTDLVVWSNVTGVPGATSECSQSPLCEACRPTGATIRFRISFSSIHPGRLRHEPHTSIPRSHLP